MTQDAVNSILKEAVLTSAEDPAYFCRFFLREWFPRPMPPVHLGLLALFTRKVAWLDKPEYHFAHDFILTHFKYIADPADPNSPEISMFMKNSAGEMCLVAGDNVACIMPRGFSKTTLENAANLYELVTDPSVFIVYVSESSDHAERQLGNIKRQLERNKLLRAAYGNVVPKRADSEKWGADEIQLKNPTGEGSGAILLARGRGSQVRGLNYDARRPNRILLDDVEDKESVATAAQRKKVSDWFYADVVPAGNEMEEEEGSAQRQERLQITVLGTLLDAEALLITLQRDITFSHVRFGAKLEDGTMLWPDKMSEQSYHAKRERYRRAGKLAEFAREFDSVIRVDEDALFQFTDITLYEPVALDKLVQLAIAGDPAISDQPGRDHTALVVTGRHESGKLWVLDVWGGLGITPTQIVDKIFELHKRYDSRAIVGIEAQQYQKALVHLLREAMGRKGQFFTVKPIIQGNDKTKDDRIAGILQPRYSNGWVRHVRPFMQLEQQLQDFPNGKKDYADALAMSFSLLGETALLAADPASIVLQDEYEPLAPLGGSLYSSSQTHIFPSGGQGGTFDPVRSGRYGN